MNGLIKFRKANHENNIHQYNKQTVFSKGQITLQTINRSAETLKVI